MVFNIINNNPDISAIIFDCDGVLIDNEYIIVESAVKAINSLGLHCTNEDYTKQYLGKTLEVFIKEITAAYAAEFARPLPASFFNNLVRNTTQKVRKNLQAMPNIHGCLKQLNIPLAVASSSAMKSLRSKLTELKLIANFEPHIYSGEQVKRSKPHPDLFLFVAKRLQIDAKKCVVIEDSVNGVMSAFAAGMTVIGFTGGTHCLPGHGKQLAAHGASSIITDMNELSLHLNLKRRI